MDVGNLFEDYGLIQTRFDISKLPQGSSLEDKATNDAIELGAEEIEIDDDADGAVNVIILIFTHDRRLLNNNHSFMFSSYAVQWF